MYSLLLLLFFSAGLQAVQKNDSHITSALTCHYNGGRFGDNLASISKLIWLHYKTGLPCIIKPFRYWEQLVLYDYFSALTLDAERRFQRKQKLPNNGRFDIHATNNTLYISYFQLKVPIDWNDQIFLKLFKQLIAPRNDIELVTIPDDHASVAVHVRRGGGFKHDTKVSNVKKTQFPPDKFYIEQIARLVSLIPEEKIYIHIFTDDFHPEQIVNRYKDAVSDERIVWGYRKQGNRHDVNVLEDFFSMTKCQYLICPQSQFSMFAERLGNHRIIIHPKHERGRNKRKISSVIIRERTPNGWSRKTVPY